MIYHGNKHHKFMIRFVKKITSMKAQEIAFFR